MKIQEILDRLPYDIPFRFVDQLTHIDENGAAGTFTFKGSSDFFKGHFTNRPVTPGVLLLEAMAQIGVVCLGIYLNGKDSLEGIALASAEADFLRPVYPDEKVTVHSEKIYFRFGKLKCRVTMINANNEKVCTAVIAGIITRGYE